jgi:hypothetical protein
MIESRKNINKKRRKKIKKEKIKRAIDMVLTLRNTILEGGHLLKTLKGKENNKKDLDKKSR